LKARWLYLLKSRLVKATKKNDHENRDQEKAK